MSTRMFIDGDWCDAASGATIEATSPATGESLGPVAEGDRDDARRAIAAANAAFPAWAARTGFERAELMHRVADACERRRDELARLLTLDQGKPLKAEAEGEVGELIEFWRMAAEDGKRLEGRIPESAAPGTARAAAAPPARRGRADHPLELALHDARGGAGPRPGLRQLRGLDARRPPPRSARACWPSAWRRPTCRRACSTWCSARAPRWATSSP